MSATAKRHTVTLARFVREAMKAGMSEDDATFHGKISRHLGTHVLLNNELWRVRQC